MKRHPFINCIDDELPASWENPSPQRHPQGWKTGVITIEIQTNHPEAVTSSAISDAVYNALNNGEVKIPSVKVTWNN